MDRHYSSSNGRSINISDFTFLRPPYNQYIPSSSSFPVNNMSVQTPPMYTPSQQNLPQFPAPTPSTNRVVSSLQGSCSSYSYSSSPTTTSSHSGTWQHQIPATMPWGINSERSTQLQFTGVPGDHLLPSSQVVMSPSLYGHRTKRKVEDEESGSMMHCPTKIHVNEEKMSAWMRDLSLSNNNLQWHPNNEQNSINAFREETDSAENECPENKLRLEISDELKLGLKTQEILPQMIMDDMNKSSMQLVLWSPRGVSIKDRIKKLNKKSPNSVHYTSSSTSNNVSDFSSLLSHSSDVKVNSETDNRERCYLSTNPQIPAPNFSPYASFARESPLIGQDISNKMDI